MCDFIEWICNLAWNSVTQIELPYAARSDRCLEAVVKVLLFLQSTLMFVKSYSETHLNQFSTHVNLRYLLFLGCVHNHDNDNLGQFFIFYFFQSWHHLWLIFYGITLFVARWEVVRLQDETAQALLSRSTFLLIIQPPRKDKIKSWICTYSYF